MRICAAAEMNVVRRVADTVRRQTAVFRAASNTEQPLIADPETEPYKYEVQKLVIYNLGPGTTTTSEEKVHAIARIGHLSWTGGSATAEFAGANYMQLFVNVLQDDEPQSMKLVVKLLSELCYGCQKNQDLVRNHHLIDTLIEMMCESDEQTRKWCLHTLFCALIGNETNQAQAVHNPKFENCVKQGLRDDWTGWEHNEAQELARMTDINM